jgi:hypothetical protein
MLESTIQLGNTLFGSSLTGLSHKAGAIPSVENLAAQDLQACPLTNRTTSSDLLATKG